MRIKLLCVCLGLVLLLAGCGSGQPVQTDIKFDFELIGEHGTFFINAEVGEDAVKYTVLSPESIEGLTFVFLENTVETEFLSHQQTFPNKSGEYGILGSLYNAFSGLRGAVAQKSGDKYIAEITVDGVNYTFTVTEMGLPISVRFGDNEIYFRNITNL